MSETTLTQVPSATTGMLIRRPVAEVFEALVDPEITRRFWFTKGSGKLESNERIVFEWPGYSGPTTVEWKFTPRHDGTFVSVTESGFAGSGDELIKYVADSTQGFTLTLAGMKALLEHGVRLNLVADRYPGDFEEEACA